MLAFPWCGGHSGLFSSVLFTLSEEAEDPPGMLGEHGTPGALTTSQWTGVSSAKPSADTANTPRDLYLLKVTRLIIAHTCVDRADSKTPTWIAQQKPQLHTGPGTDRWRAASSFEMFEEHTNYIKQD